MTTILSPRTPTEIVEEALELARKHPGAWVNFSCWLYSENGEAVLSTKPEGNQMGEEGLNGVKQGEGNKDGG